MINSFIYFFKGKGGGSLLGGFLLSEFGKKTTFQIFGGASFFIAFIYYLFFKLHIQAKRNKLARKQREVSNMPVEVIPKEYLVKGLKNTPEKSFQLPQNKV